MEYICDVKESDFPCKFFVLNVEPDTTVRMTWLKHINTYLNEIEAISMAPVYKHNSLVFNIKYGVFKFDDKEQEVDWDSTERFPRIVIWGTELL
jgi:hypothetical protein